jgi:hypothetical protein
MTTSELHSSLTTGNPLLHYCFIFFFIELHYYFSFPPISSDQNSKCLLQLPIDMLNYGIKVPSFENVNAINLVVKYNYVQSVYKRM